MVGHQPNHALLDFAQFTASVRHPMPILRPDVTDSSQLPFSSFSPDVVRPSQATSRGALRGVGLETQPVSWPTKRGNPAMDLS